MVVEADESDGSFMKLPATIAIVTNMDPEHLDYYGTVEVMNRAYETFVENIPFYGFAALCIDHPVVQAMIPRLIDRRIITYGFSPQADVRATDLTMHPDGSQFRVVITDRYRDRQREITSVRLPIGRPAQCAEHPGGDRRRQRDGVDDAKIRSGLAGFGGVKRRFTRTGETRGVTVIDDYGHQSGGDRGGADGRASSLQRSCDCRGAATSLHTPALAVRTNSAPASTIADVVLVADVYSAGETPIEGVNA